MRLYNSLTKQIEEFSPLKPDAVGLYSCGPTVYSDLHIGNLAAFIYADVLRRVLRLAGYDVSHVMNITDVDDKTIRDSHQNYPHDEPKTALLKLTDKYTGVFMRDFEAVGGDTKAITFVSAVQSIPEMVKLIQQIADKGLAYAAEDGVYFSISEYQAASHTYGRLQNVDITELQSRIANDEYDKDHVSDFALWKAAAPNEPAWEATFTIDGQAVVMPGRPGWHIECSAMSQKLLGVPFDIHTGGVDLKFPHHENEIAQTVGAGAPDLAKVFVHNNHILVDGRKMSKSLGNVITLREIEQKGFTTSAFRLLVLESHYQSESNFSWDILQAAANRLKKWQQVMDLLWQETTVVKSSDIGKSFVDSLATFLADNLDTPHALAFIDGVMDEILNDGMLRDEIKNIAVAINEALGLDLMAGRRDINDEQKDLLHKRQLARETQNWEASDHLRQELQDSGLGVRDTEHGQIWYRL